MNVDDTNAMAAVKQTVSPLEDFIQVNSKDVSQPQDSKKVSKSPEIFLTDDNIIHIQESQTMDGDVIMEEVVPQEAREPTDLDIPKEMEMQHKQPQDRRRSERLKKDTTLTTKEKNERMAKKGIWKVLALIRICFLFYPLMIL